MIHVEYIIPRKSKKNRNRRRKSNQNNRPEKIYILVRSLIICYLCIYCFTGFYYHKGSLAKLSYVLYFAFLLHISVCFDGDTAAMPCVSRWSLAYGWKPSIVAIEIGSDFVTNVPEPCSNASWQGRDGICNGWNSSESLPTPRAGGSAMRSRVLKPENHEALSMIDIVRNARGHASTSRHHKLRI